jgi:diphosphomevalonate decarboxylase
MNRFEAAQLYLQGRKLQPLHGSGTAYAPANIALIKYWGKRQNDLNLPMNSSLSLSMGERGATTTLTCHGQDEVICNGERVNQDAPFVQKIIEYLDIIDPARPCLKIDTTLTIPPAAGLASSAAGFAALILALDRLCGWELPETALSCLARLGSGSAARSLWQGFVEWHQGSLNDGSDCFAEPLPIEWPQLRLGLVILESTNKKVSSRAGMLYTVATSPLYKAWPETAAADLRDLKAALLQQDFHRLGQIAEHNALAMHATMLAARPSLMYSTPATLQAMHMVWAAREQGLPVYFTQDAGPNLKLLFEESYTQEIYALFPEVQIVNLKHLRAFQEINIYLKERAIIFN